MPFARPRRIGLALACALAMTTTACVVTPLVDLKRPGGGVGATANGLNPVIHAFNASPRETKDKDAKITFDVVAVGLNDEPLQFNWTATKGTLSATSGRLVTWSPTKADGSLEAAGDAQISVIITTASGGAVTGTAIVKILADGAAKVVSTGGVAGPSAKPTDKPTDKPNAKPTDKPDAKPSDKPAAEPTASPSPAALACEIEKVTPSLAAPASVIVVHGEGFTGDAKVTVGPYATEIVQQNEHTITAKLPADAKIEDTAHPVVVTICGTEHKLESTVTVADTKDFGKPVAEAGAGLLANVHQLEPGTDKLPEDLDKRKPHSSLLVGNLDVPTRDFTTGFPGVSGDLVEWFAISFTGDVVTKAGKHVFTLSSDDGSKLWIDGKLVVDNDGIHATAEESGEVELTAGAHEFRLDYFQGPATEISLQLYWTEPGAEQRTIVPATAFVQDAGHED